jgi:DNA repair protein RecO (recombination protein O)
MTTQHLRAAVYQEQLESLSTNTLQSGTQEWEARMLMRDLIRYYLEDAPLNTRRILNELNKL